MQNNNLRKPTIAESSRIRVKPSNFSVQLIRHATLLVHIGPYEFLVDPMLSPKHTMEPVQDTSNPVRIPMTDLPYGAEWVEEMVAKVDAVIVTHTHRDHWDNEAQQRIPKDKPVFCQPSDVELIKARGFLNVATFEDLERYDIMFHRTGGRHGTGEIGKKMGIVSGVVVKYKNETLYLVGDSIWCQEVKDAIEQHRPDAIVVNSGAAQFITGDPITMDAEDILLVLKDAGEAKVIAVHMDTVNHCHLTRFLLQSYLESENLADRVQIPLDGDVVTI